MTWLTLEVKEKEFEIKETARCSVILKYAASIRNVKLYSKVDFRDMRSLRTAHQVEERNAGSPLLLDVAATDSSNEANRRVAQH